MLLVEAAECSKIYLEVENLYQNGARFVNYDPFIFDMMDGPDFAHLFKYDDPSRVLHLKADTPIKKYKDGYKVTGESQIM